MAAALYPQYHPSAFFLFSLICYFILLFFSFFFCYLLYEYSFFSLLFSRFLPLVLSKCPYKSESILVHPCRGSISPLVGCPPFSSLLFSFFIYFFVCLFFSLLIMISFSFLFFSFLFSSFDFYIYIVVGISFGGALLFDLIRSREWSGLSLLMCPALIPGVDPLTLDKGIPFSLSPLFLFLFLSYFSYFLFFICYFLDLTSPMILCHGTADMVVPVSK